MTQPLALRVRLLRPGARLPCRATPGSTGLDLYACTGGESLPLGQHPVAVPTGIALEAPPGSDVQVRPRSGLARRGVLAAYGTIDSDYRGELIVTMYTTAPGIEHTVHDGDRIAQLVVSLAPPVDVQAVEALSATERDSGGFGSTGR